MTNFLIPALATLSLIGAGILHGFYSGRWVPSETLVKAVDASNSLPLELDGWKGEVFPLDDPESLVRAGVRGSCQVRYVNATGGSVVVLIVAGKPGPISVHDPSVCYGAAGYKIAGNPKRIEVPEVDRSTKDVFYTADFIPPSPTETSFLRIAWAWGQGQTWLAPDNPRLTFAGSPYLFKIYGITNVLSTNSKDTTNLSIELMKKLIPELRKKFSDL